MSNVMSKLIQVMRIRSGDGLDIDVSFKVAKQWRKVLLEKGDFVNFYAQILKIPTKILSKIKS